MKGWLAAWTAWTNEQRTAAIAAALLVVSTLGPFSFVEAALILVASGVLALLRARGGGKRFELPCCDGTLLVAAGAWSAVLIAVRVFDRPLGQNLLALGCAVLLTLAGLLLRSERSDAGVLPPRTPTQPPAPAPPPEPVPLPAPAAPPTAVAPPAAQTAASGVQWLNGDPTDRPTKAPHPVGADRAGQ